MIVEISCAVSWKEPVIVSQVYCNVAGHTVSFETDGSLAVTSFFGCHCRSLRRAYAKTNG